MQGCKPGGIWDATCGTERGSKPTDADLHFANPVSALNAPTTAGSYHLMVGSRVIVQGTKTLTGTGLAEVVFPEA